MGVFIYVFVSCPHMTAQPHPVSVWKLVAIRAIISMHKYVLKNYLNKLDSDSL